MGEEPREALRGSGVSRVPDPSAGSGGVRDFSGVDGPPIQGDLPSVLQSRPEPPLWDSQRLGPLGREYTGPLELLEEVGVGLDRVNGSGRPDPVVPPPVDGPRSRGVEPDLEGEPDVEGLRRRLQPSRECGGGDNCDFARSLGEAHRLKEAKEPRHVVAVKVSYEYHGLPVQSRTDAEELSLSALPAVQHEELSVSSDHDGGETSAPRRSRGAGPEEDDFEPDHS